MILLKVKNNLLYKIELCMVEISCFVLNSYKLFFLVYWQTNQTETCDSRQMVFTEIWFLLISADVRINNL